MIPYSTNVKGSQFDTLVSDVYHMDCVEGMKKYPDKFFDLAIVDLEYNIGASAPSIKPDFVKQSNGTFLRINQPNYKKRIGILRSRPLNILKSYSG